MLNKRNTIKQAHPKDKEINLKNFHASQTVSFEDLKSVLFEGNKTNQTTNKQIKQTLLERKGNIYEERW